jgi:hypothetical protein
MEHWKQIPTLNYFVSDLGRVKNSEGGFLGLHPSTNAGHLTCHLRKDGKRCQRKVHRLVYEAFVRPLKTGECVHHLDGNVENNTPSNLEAMSFGSHSHHHQIGSKNSFARLTENQVKVIKQALAEGVGRKVLAKQYNVHPSTIDNIKAGRSWAWL